MTHHDAFASRLAGAQDAQIAGSPDVAAVRERPGRPVAVPREQQGLTIEGSQR